MSARTPSGLTRRSALRLLGSSAGLALLAACQPAAPATAPPAPTNPAPAPAPTTAAPAPTPVIQVTAPPAPAAATKPAQGQPRTGGTLRFAQTADVATLDPYL